MDGGARGNRRLAPSRIRQGRCCHPYLLLHLHHANGLKSHMKASRSRGNKKPSSMAVTPLRIRQSPPDSRPNEGCSVTRSRLISDSPEGVSSTSGSLTLGWYCQVNRFECLLTGACPLGHSVTSKLLIPQRTTAALAGYRVNPSVDRFRLQNSRFLLNLTSTRLVDGQCLVARQHAHNSRRKSWISGYR